jgi:hypothetical protein
MKKITKINITIILILSIIISYGSVIISMAAESELTLTPKPETNNIHLKWTGPQNSSYKVYQKKPDSNQFETIGLTDFSNNATDEEVKVLNIYPQENNANPRLYPDQTPEQVRQHFTSLPKVQVTYLDGQTETIPKSALLKVWMEGRNSKRR